MEVDTTTPESDSVIVLDDDNNVVEDVIDLVKGTSALNTRCINYECDSGVDLMPAPQLCLSHYRVATRKTGQEVCRQCFNIAVESYHKLSTKLVEGKVLCNMDLPYRPDHVELVDSDDEDSGGGESMHVPLKPCNLSDNNVRFLMENFDRILAETMDKVNFKDHIQKEVDYLCNQSDQIDCDVNALQEEMRTVRKTLESIQTNIYDVGRVNTVEKAELHITDIGSGDGKRTLLPPLPPLVGISAPSARRVVRKSTSIDTVVSSPSDLPRMGCRIVPKVEIGDVFYVARENKIVSWVKATVKAYSFDEKRRRYTYTMQELQHSVLRVVGAKSLGCLTPSIIRFEVGTRVIAVFRDVLSPPPSMTDNNDHFYAGIVAEPPVQKNRYRYLVFFDIGCSQYVDYNKVHQVVESSNDVCNDIPQNQRHFMRQFLMCHERPMVKLTTGQSTSVEYDGKWMMCTVAEIDCSLARLVFVTLNRMEWIYRGSTRLRAIYNEHFLNKSQQQQRQDSFKAPSSRAVARKSTTNTIATAMKSTSSRPPPPLVSFLLDTEEMVEPPSKIMYFTPRDQMITTRVLKPHLCSVTCKDFVRLNLAKLRGQNPLAKPLLHNWARITTKAKQLRRDIIYKTPCGRMLRSIEEVHQYLILTKSDLTVDLFDFDNMIRCLAEFHVERTPDTKDLSNGLEHVSVPVINGFDNRPLAFVKYMNRRVPMEDVPLDLDSGFLAGCDCDEDCRDRTKCSCWRLTLDGAKYAHHQSSDRIGYQYRRLYEPVVTGIYECNANCKCAATCLNRVVQHPMSLKLQVFKTQNRGWGIRCVNDVPKGTFICIYAGTIHTEQMANEDGKTYGDEYFAELDYIEICERHKEDYEAEAKLDNDSSNTDEDETESVVLSVDDHLKLLQPHHSNSTAATNTIGELYSATTTQQTTGDDSDFVFNGRVCPSNMRMTLRKKRQKPTTAIPSTSNTSQQHGTETEPMMISDDDDDDVKEVLNVNKDETKVKSVREYFGEDEPYIMDTKNAGNIGRFLNHSCAPNVFVQNVFVDSHDVRFPWVAFFSLQPIRAGSELTWNYNYDVGSVPGRVLYCKCGTPECKGRLL